MTHRPKVLGTGRIPNLNLARYVIGGLDAFGEKGGGDCGWTGVFAVVAFGEAGYEGGFANVTVAEEDYLEFSLRYLDMRHISNDIIGEMSSSPRSLAPVVGMVERR
mmetsp:Transcript_1101/g.2548  ORF Transcript_1101/g.2548 Transcript_1101/m.2548 type:complete len:106 (+) Transcript_1101:1083-1400(+)